MSDSNRPPAGEEISPAGIDRAGPTPGQVEQHDTVAQAGRRDQLQLPAWMTRAAPNPDPRRRHRVRAWLDDHGLKVLAIGIVVALFVPFGLMIRDVWLAPPGTPSYISAVNVYAGTDAARYREGLTGIEPPEAHPTTGFTAEQVGTALGVIRQALAASRLDDRMLTGHDPGAFLDLLAPADRAARHADFADGSVPFYATQISARIPLAEVAPRVQGEITYQGITLAGAPVLEVVTRFTWVYAFDVQQAGRGRHLVTVTDGLVWHVVPATHTDASARGLHLFDGASRAENAECEAYRKGRITPAGRIATPCAR
ncbi:hypothetical protein ACQEVC_07860 [Plantactinospora sp. CA-294935]|uniref:hypothetical protein n=1 Tax=Plantactinospora sp. CA-294935 TaxID=3240012 RepID=UPI003D92B93E